MCGRPRGSGRSCKLLASSEEHRLPQPGKTVGTAERRHLKPDLLQQGFEGARTPEPDVAAVTGGGELGAELAAGGKGQVLEVAEIRGRADQHNARLEGTITL